MKSLVIPGAHYFVSASNQPRVRRASDAATCLIGLALLVAGLLAADNSPAWEQALVQLVASAPEWVGSLLSLGYALSLLYALAVVIALLRRGRDGRGALRDVALAALGASVLTILLSFVINDGWPYVLPEIDLQNPVPRFPVLRVALVTAVLVAVSPHLVRPLRRFGWLTILISSTAAVALGYGTPLHTLGSVGIGLVCAGLLLVIAGSPRGYPDPESVAEVMRALGTETRGVSIRPEQSWGMRRFTATALDGSPLDIKVYGRDAADSQLTAKMWRTLWYREIGRTVSATRLQAVEHDALVTVMAREAGVPVPGVIAVGQASSEMALVAHSGGGIPLDAMPDVADEKLIEVWREVRRIHESGMSHGSLTTAAVRVDGQEHRISEFALGSLAARDADRAGDVVQFLFSLSLLVGPERAVHTARTGLGEEQLAASLPYLQVPALGASTRRLADEPKKQIATLHKLVIEATGVDPPEPVKLRRVSVRNLIMTALLLLVVWALIPLFTSVDYAEVWGQLQDADWTLVFLALVVGQTYFFPQATAVMSAAPVQLAFWPLVTLQVASQFVSLAVPSAAGRVAMNAAFLHKFGMTIAVAISIGAIDGFSGFLVQSGILLIGFLTGDIDIQVDTSNVQWALILGVIVVLAVATVTVVLRVRRIRDRIVPVLSQGWGALRNVLRSPSRAFGILGSYLVYWNILGLTLWLLLQALGVDLDYISALMVATGTSLLAGFMPIPGGIGVAEAAMTAFLSFFGVDQSTAFAATVVYRVITFYLPALEGFFGMRWLERNEYL